MFEYKGEKFLTDEDLEIVDLGRYPEVIIQNEELKKIFEKKCGRSFLGGDEIISFRQALVARGMNFNGLEDEILKKVKETEKPISEIVFEKTATGIGRGHSMGGLSGIVLGLHGTKMIDSGLTGLVSSRSLVTSGRRRSVQISDIVIPRYITDKEDILKKYLQTSKDAFRESQRFKETFGKLEGIESFNKALAYNNPADLFLVLPLDTMATIIFEVIQDNLNPNGPFLPKEIHELAKRIPEIADRNGMGTMLRQRIKVPRDTYFHYNVFKDPDMENYVSDIIKKEGIPIKPLLLELHKDITQGFKKKLKEIEEKYKTARNATDPDEIYENAMRCMLNVRDFVGEYNESIRAKIFDTLSFRVWSEQKRHATLRQGVESIYSSTQRAWNILKEVMPQIENSYSRKNCEVPLEKIEKAIIIDNRLKKNPELVVPYIYHSAKQLELFNELLGSGASLRDAAFMIPRNTRITCIENYDLANIIGLELPLRLCSECEPERYKTSWQKRNLLAKAIPEIKELLQPKCSVGFCTEGDYCKHIEKLRKYDDSLHRKIKEVMLYK